MRLRISKLHSDAIVIAEPFEIAGSAEKFAVHANPDWDASEDEAWSATHVETGFRVAKGATVDEAIEAGRRVWLSKTPEQRAAALSVARQVRQARDSVQAGGAA